MKININFDPASDDMNDVLAAVAGAYGNGITTEKVEAPDDGDDEAAKKADAAAKRKAKADAKKKADAEAAAEEAEPDGPSRDDVRNKLKEYAALEGKEAAIGILKNTGGAASIGELDEDKFADVIAACE